MSTVAVSRLIEKMELTNLTPDIDVKNRKITIPQMVASVILKNCFIIR